MKFVNTILLLHHDDQRIELQSCIMMTNDSVTSYLIILSVFFFQAQGHKWQSGSRDKSCDFWKGFVTNTPRTIYTVRKFSRISAENIKVCNQTVYLLFIEILIWQILNQSMYNFHSPQMRRSTADGGSGEEYSTEVDKVRTFTSHL